MIFFRAKTHRATAVILIIICFSSLLCTSCNNLDKEKEGLVSVVDYKTLEYQGEKYICLKENIFSAYNKEDRELRYKDYVLVSWNFNFPISVKREYYSYSTESPDFIVDDSIDRTVWFNESYDFKQETFVIENTEIEIAYCDAFENERINLNYQVDTQSFYWHTKTHYALRTRVDVFCVDDIYYMSIPRTEYSYKISEPFLDLLIENKIIIPN